jgi:hypothetical protein
MSTEEMPALAPVRLLNRESWTSAAGTAAIFCHGADQQALATASRDTEQWSMTAPIVTEITAASAFLPR